ncbi:MAG: hypothetical protein HQL32_14245 [Planctomycetes bacterium]|nr:hypothetical protein [Planctomycetota bacterium]
MTFCHIFPKCEVKDPIALELLAMEKNKTSYYTNRRTFSLVELLVMMAVFAVLMFLFVPTMNKYINYARAVQCTASYKTLGQAVFLYMSEFNDAFPPNKRRLINKDAYTSALFVSWDDLFGYYQYDGRDLSEEEANLKWAQNSSSLYECPLVKTDYAGIHQLRTPAMNCTKNDKGIGDRFQSSPPAFIVSMHDIPSPSETIALFESDSDGFLGNTENSGISQSINKQLIFRNNNLERVHDYQFNYLFCDGHAKLLLPEDTVKSDYSNPNSPGKYWTKDPDD